MGRPSAPRPMPKQDEFSCLHVCPGSALRGWSDREENGTANHAKHAKGGGALQVQDDAFDLKARLAEVEQQAEMQTCGFQIIQALRAMNLVDRPGYFQFDEDHVFDEQVNRIVPDHNAIVSNDHAMLLRDGDSGLAKLVQQSVFIDFLKESASQPVEHRQGAANNTLDRRLARYLFIGLHLRVLRVLRFHLSLSITGTAFPIR